MSGNHFHISSAAPKHILWVTALCAIIAIMASPVQGANLVDIRTNYDTLGTCVFDEFQIWIENDYPIGGLSLGFKIWSPDPSGLFWSWRDVGGYGPSGCVRDVPGSRLYPADSVFDLGGVQVQEHSLDGDTPDTILVGGVAMMNAIQPGPLQKMITLAFNATGVADYPLCMVCIDSVFVPPAGNFVFVDAIGGAHAPQVTWPSGGKCWPVSRQFCLSPVWDEGLPTSMTIPYSATGTVTLSAYNIDCEARVLFGNLVVTGGTGQAELTDNGDNTCDVSYAPTEEDIGRPITISVGARNYFVGFDCSLPHEISVTVIDAPLGLDCGWPYLSGATNNPITKTDISPINGEYYGDLAYSMVSGPGEIDPDSGTYTWTPGPTDIGQFPVEVRVAGSGDTATCTFTVDVVDENCCPGDANFSGGADVGDAVFLINYIFRSGMAPRVMNWGDANADCMVNVGDAVRLIYYIFKSGPPPILGCVN